MAASITLKQFILQLEDKRFIELLAIFGDNTTCSVKKSNNTTVDNAEFIPNELLLDDLSYLNPYELLQSVPGRYKIKMQLLINRKLKKYFYTNLSIKPPGVIISKTARPHPRQADTSYIPKQLYLSGKICSAGAYNLPGAENLPVCEVNELIYINFTDLSQVNLLNLSACKLMDHDMRYVVEFCSKLLQLNAPLQYVIVNHNFLHKCDDEIIKLLKMGLIVNIANNRLITISRKECVRSYYRQYLPQLIWLTKDIVAKDIWYNMFADENLNVTIRQTHNEYYAYYPNVNSMDWIDYNL